MDAAVELKGGVIQTPVLQSDALARSGGADVYLKLENQQHTGSFKYRGALNKLLSLGASPSPVIGASTGNHGLAMSMVLRELELEGTIFLPSTTAKHKVNSLRNHDINLAFHGKDGIEAEQKARHTAECEGGCFHLSLQRFPNHCRSRNDWRGASWSRLGRLTISLPLSVVVD